jgi:hypothetical protein
MAIYPRYLAVVILRMFDDSAKIVPGTTEAYDEAPVTI